MNRQPSVLLVISLVCGIAACGKKSEKSAGQSLGIPATEPPVAETIPAGLKTSGAGLIATGECGPNESDDCTDDMKIATLKNRVFLSKAECTGGAGADVAGLVRCSLNAIDIRMADLDAQSQEEGGARTCTHEAVKDFSPTVPGVGVFTQKYSCYKKITNNSGQAEIYLAFGVDGDTVYLRESETNGQATLVKMEKSTRAVEVVQIRTKVIKSSASDSDSATTVEGSAENDGKNATSVLHMTASPADKVFQLAVGSNHAFGLGVGCGVQIRSTADLIYAKGIFGEPNKTLQVNCATAGSETSARRYLEACLTADLSVDPLTACAAIRSFDLAAVEPSVVDQTVANVASDTAFSSLTSFDVKDSN